MEKKIIWGGLAGGVTFFLLGWLLYGMLFRDFMAAQTTAGVYKDEPDFPFLIIGNIIMGFLFAIVVGSWANANSMGDGAKKGFLLSLLIGGGYDFMMYGTANIMTMQGMMGDIGITIVMGTIVGAVVGMVMGSSKKAAG